MKEFHNDKTKVVYIVSPHGSVQYSVDLNTGLKTETHRWNICVEKDDKEFDGFSGVDGCYTRAFLTKKEAVEFQKLLKGWGYESATIGTVLLGT